MQFLTHLSGPGDAHRPHLYLGISHQQSDYINAVYVNVISLILATQHSKHTLHITLIRVKVYFISKQLSAQAVI